ncbi:MAG: hypothetical protein MZV63_18730 [Marinilabiliales bacterium]|nr:hypothetical protein [Marinilabiliales bacterium]
MSIVSLSTKGLSKGIDFTGGRTYIVKFETACQYSRDCQPAFR